MDRKKITEWYADWAINYSNDPYGEIEWLVSKLDDEAFKEIIDVYEMQKSLVSGNDTEELPFN